MYLRRPRVGSLYRSSTTRTSMTGGSRSSDNTASLLKDLFGTDNRTKPTNREPSREPNREPRREQNRGPNIDKPGSPIDENHRLSGRIHRLELNLGAVNQNNRELKDRNQAQNDTIRDLNAQLKVEKNKARDVEAQLRAAERDRAELAKYRNAERSGTALDSFHEDLKREAADINATCFRDICDAVDCIAEGGFGHVADGIFRIKDALAK